MLRRTSLVCRKKNTRMRNFKERKSIIFVICCDRYFSIWNEEELNYMSHNDERGGIFRENGWCNKWRSAGYRGLFSPYGLKAPLLYSPPPSPLHRFVSSRLLTRRRARSETTRGVGWGFVKSLWTALISSRRDRRFRDEVSLSFRSSFSSAEEVCLSDNERSFRERARSGRLRPSTENGWPIASFDPGSNESQRILRFSCFRSAKRSWMKTYFFLI